jgi:hypothetical protein
MVKMPATLSDSSTSFYTARIAFAADKRSRIGNVEQFPAGRSGSFIKAVAARCRISCGARRPDRRGVPREVKKPKRTSKQAVQIGLSGVKNCAKILNVFSEL